MISVRHDHPAATTDRLLTAEELGQLSDDGNRYDLVYGVVVARDKAIVSTNGKLIEMSRPKPRHGLVAGRLISRVGHFVATHRLGEVFVESDFVVVRNPDVIRGPDLAFVAIERLPTTEQLDQYFEGAPDLAVEIVLPNDSAFEVRERIDQYLGAGAKLVWIIYPMFKTVEVHRPELVMMVLRATDTLDGEAVLPGFALPVAALFE